jgi:hypothetical protein
MSGISSIICMLIKHTDKEGTHDRDAFELGKETGGLV